MHRHLDRVRDHVSQACGYARQVRRCGRAGHSRARQWLIVAAAALSSAGAAACQAPPPTDRVRVSGQVEATDVQVAAPVPGRLLQRKVSEGDRVEKGAVIATLDTADAELAITRARAERAQAEAQLRLLQAGSRPEDVRLAESQVAPAQADVAVAEADLAAAEVDVQRFEQLLAANSGSRKQRDDAVARRNVARERVTATRDRVRVAQEGVARVKAGARRQEIDAARARIDAVAAQIATLEKAVADATVIAPVRGVVTTTVADEGELLQPRAPIAVITDLDHAWANVYVDEPVVPRLRVGDAATLFTDAGGPGVMGTISYISERAEFTPRNVQTADDRSKLVYRLKVSMDNAAGVFKAGMPVEAEIVFAR
ncbi:MAG TPA: HlyD family efflux transporter periplasmic adaptor subunit [Vicinamibacterales bacterium]|nr:HlyD family efflux transporter periplasmic adaptor subunit [Vicinamibacterales bacterium]